jgi:hypothetical protein
MRVLYIGTAVIGAVLVTGVLVALRPPSSGADVPLLETPAWQGRMPEYGEQLMLRRDTQTDRVLLLKHSNREAAYRYDPRTQNLTSVTEQEWGRAGGPIAECGKQFSPPPQVLRIDPQSHTLMAGQRQIPTAGTSALNLIVSPGNRFAAVLSASGQTPRSLLPFLGAGVPAGQRYNQIVSLPDAVVVGKALRIPVRRDNDVIGTCWSADETTIVYYDTLFSYLSIIEADL